MAKFLKEESIQIKDKTKANSLLSEIDREIIDILVQIPNIPNKLVPAGNSELDNEIVKEVIPKFDLKDNKKPHWDLCTEYNLIDFKLGNQITGSGFPVYKNKGG